MDDGAMLFVGKLPPSCKDGDGVIKLKHLFQKYGEVTDFIFNGTHAFVHMATEAQAKEAITYLNGHKLGNALILVALATGATAAAGRKLAQENANKQTNYAVKSETKVPAKSILKKAHVFQEPVHFKKQSDNQIGQNNVSRQPADRFTPYNTPNTSDKYNQGNNQSHQNKNINQHNRYEHSRGVGPIRGQSSQSMSRNNSNDPLAMLKSPHDSDPLAGFLSELRSATAGNDSSHSGPISNDGYRSERERQAPQRGQQSSSKPMGNDYDPLAMLKTSATPRVNNKGPSMMATPTSAHSSNVGPYSNDGYRSEREKQEYLRGNRSVHDGRQKSDDDHYSQNERNSGPSNNQRNQRDDYNQRNQRDDYNQRNQRDDYNQRNQREDYNQRNQRDYDSNQRNDSFYSENRDNYDRNTDRQRGHSRENQGGAQRNNYRGTYDDVASRNDPYAQSNDTFRPPRNTEYERASNEPPSRLAQVNADGKIVPNYPKREAQGSKFGCGADKLPNKNDMMAFLSGNF